MSVSWRLDDDAHAVARLCIVAVAERVTRKGHGRKSAASRSGRVMALRARP
ncbi:Hypothetical protein A7982_10343 [Minicystis rosea]|nr:Hypothetical protein A7982_10343 [Minicystis rosea]